MSLMSVPFALPDFATAAPCELSGQPCSEWYYTQSMNLVQDRLRRQKGINTSPNSDDSVLVKRCLAGSQDAWCELYSRFVVLVRNVICKHSRLSEMEVEDITQTVFLNLTTALKNFDAQHSLSGFICLVAQRVLVDEMRKSGAAKRTGQMSSIKDHDTGENDTENIEAPQEPPDVLIERFEQALLLRTALEQLDSSCRDLLKLRYFNGLSFGEIAVMLGITENALNVRASRCLAKLRDACKNSQERFGKGSKLKNLRHVEAP